MSEVYRFLRLTLLGAVIISASVFLWFTSLILPSNGKFRLKFLEKTPCLTFSFFLQSTQTAHLPGGSQPWSFH